MTIDVNPPRASKTSKSVPVELRSIWYRFRFALERDWNYLRSGNLRLLTRPIVRWPRLGLRDPSRGESIIAGIGDWCALIVPGLVQLRHGERVRGWVLISVYAALVLILIGYAGQPLAAGAQGFMFAWHLLSIIDAMQSRFDSFADRVVSTMMVGVALGCLVYWPATWAITRVALPVSINLSTGRFLAGDVLLVNQLATPNIGNYTLYETTQQRLQAGGGYNNPIYQIQGQRIGRVVAVGGQTVAMPNDKLMVDGVESIWQPTFSVAFSQTSVPAGSFFILPETFGIPDNLLTADLYLRLAVVDRQRIQGTAYFRTHPFSRSTSL